MKKVPDICASGHFPHRFGKLRKLAERYFAGKPLDAKEQGFALHALAAARAKTRAAPPKPHRPRSVWAKVPRGKRRCELPRPQSMCRRCPTVH